MYPTNEQEYLEMLALLWPNCETPDCENKVCTWASHNLCFPCMERIVGKEEMIKRFNETHDITWEEANSNRD